MRFRRALASVCSVVVLGAIVTPGVVVSQQVQPSAADVTPDPWPRTISLGGAKYTLYQPQLKSWDGRSLQMFAAVSVLPAGAKEPVFGALDITATTEVAKVSRTVHLSDVTIGKAVFPSALASAAQYQQAFQAFVSKGRSTMSLDRLEAMLAIAGEEQKARAVPVKNEPPRLIISSTAAVLVPIDGAPVWRSVKGTKLERVINTRALVLLDDATGRFYVHLFDGFVEAPSIAGPWVLAAKVPPALPPLAAALSKDNVVDLMTGQRNPKNPRQSASLKNGLPEVIVTTTPTELIVTDGAADWVPIEGTMLLYVKNTTGNIFQDLNDQQFYVLVTGRWFRAPNFAGPWQFVPGADLPPDFAKIPDDSPKENVKASVPATAQAEDALIENEIPQTATVERAKARFTPTISGPPELRPVPDTPLSYVFNSPSPIIMVAPSEWYAVQRGVWFTATAALGPWVVAASVPAVIYSIPVSSPLHYVTYVRVYSATPRYVVVGYTPGYLGTVVAPGGVVVYGTGYDYVSYVGPAIWYPPPITYGYATSLTGRPGRAGPWASASAWPSARRSPARRIAAGATVPRRTTRAPRWGTHGAAVWGPSGWAATSGNVYHQWGTTGAVTRTSGGYNAWTGNAWSTQVGHSYNSTTGRISAGQRGAVQNVYTGNYAYGGRGATYNPTTGVAARGGSVSTGNTATGVGNTARWGQVSGPGGQSAGVAKVDGNYYADRDGNVYKNTGGGWQSYDNGGWNSVSDQNRSQSLDWQQQARSAGDQRSAASAWGSGSWGSGFDRSSASGFGGGGWDTGGGGWDRGGFGGDGFGGGRSWGGGSFGGGFGGGRFGGRR